MAKMATTKTKSTKPTKVTKTTDAVTLVDIDYQRIGKISGIVQLKAVTLIDSAYQSLATASRVGADVGAMKYVLNLTDATWDVDGDAPCLNVHVSHRLAAFAEIEKRPQPLFSLECMWEVAFRVPDTFVPIETEALADFAVANGQFNMFPYLRQYVQDLTGRAGWPPLVLPTHRVPKNRPVHFGQRRTPPK